ncbi:hypothetical protein TrST_g7197 [Triparma strigata]|uniref:LisH domain-containing protein n=1 Tax=Triparma strigata TaxID=1606541 RepID=A0A9W7DYB5_9STRA|nr:hypothetical protein TrST_g7197 [Triparma strigata]
MAPKALTEREMRSNLRSTLKQSGVIDELTAQLRADFVRKLGGGAKKAWSEANEVSPERESRRPVTLKDRAVRSLIANYLQAEGLNHTLSVFAPESGISSVGEMSVEDSLKSLGVSEFSGSFDDIVGGAKENDGSVLATMVGCLEKLSNEMEAQHLKVRSGQEGRRGGGGTRAEDNLSKKLGELQQSYEDAMHNARTNPDKGLEEKMLAFQKECEGRLSSQMQNDLNRFRAHDLDMMRLEEQAKYRNELAALRLEMKAEYDLRVQKKEETELKKLNNVRMQAQALEQAQYHARQEVSRELDLVRRKEVDSRREIDVRKRAVELMEQRTKNLKEALEKRELELNSHESGLKHKYMVEFDRARDEAKKTYEGASASLAAQQKVLDAELASVKRDREELQRLKKQVVEKHGSVLNDDADFDNIRMERDSLKIKLGEVQSQLAAFHVHYDNDMEEAGRASPDQGGRSPSPAKLLRSLSSSTGGGAGNPMSRSWRDHRNALESELERAERELDETKALLDSERDRTEQLRERERATFEKAATLEAVANSLKQRLEDAERATKDAVREKEVTQCDYDAMKLEIGELRQLMLKQQNIVEMVGKKKAVGSSSSKNDMREARLEKVRQRAKEQMKLDIKILDEKEEREKLERARESSKSAPSETAVAAANEAASAQLEAIRRLELRLAKAEILLDSEKDKSKYQNEIYSMMLQQQQQQQPVAPQVVYQQVTAPPPQQQAIVAAPPPQVMAAPPPAAAAAALVVEKTTSVGFAQKPAQTTMATTTGSETEIGSGSGSGNGTGGAKSENWEQEYHDFIVSQEEEQQQQQKQMKEQKAKSQLELQQAQQRLDSAEQDRLKRKAEETEALEAAEREAEMEAQKVREEQKKQQQQQQKQQQAAATAEDEKKKKADDKKKAELDRAEKKRQKEEEEAARWEAKERERKAKKDLERKQKEEAAKKEMEEQRLREAEDRKRITAATRLQAQGRRRRASLKFEQMKEEKAASMSAIEKAKLERDKKAAIEQAKKKAEEDAERERVQAEHEEARRRATERIREQRAREGQERAEREREERDREARRLSGGGGTGGEDSDPLEISDESFSSDNYEDW